MLSLRLDHEGQTRSYQRRRFNALTRHLAANFVSFVALRNLCHFPGTSLGRGWGSRRSQGGSGDTAADLVGVDQTVEPIGMLAAGMAWAGEWHFVSVTTFSIRCLSAYWHHRRSTLLFGLCCEGRKPKPYLKVCVLSPKFLGLFYDLCTGECHVLRSIDSLLLKLVFITSSLQNANRCTSCQSYMYM